MDQVLDRFHRVLVEEIEAHRPEYLEAPFTVAEIYQNLVPYGTHRDRVGVEMNGDYEHALVRMLAGDGEYLVLESAAALRALREELDSANPNTGIYREYAAVDVRLNPERTGAVESDPEPATEEAPLDGEPVGGEPIDGEPVAVELVDDLVPVGNLAPVERVEDVASTAAEQGEGDSCSWCRAVLPERPNLNFCPFCGTDVKLVPCPDCGGEVEPGWRFCIGCGTEVDG
jgi:hypothetical protein